MIDIIERLQQAETRPLAGTDSWVELWKVLWDARIALTRLEAITESLRREVREQRREIAGLREERRALLDADRPQPDRPGAISEAESDRPTPIADCDTTDDPAESAESGGDSGCEPQSSVQTPPAWTSRPYYVDPPSGHRYGFPRLYDPATDGNMTEWMIRNGYPEKLARLGLPCTFTAATEDGET